MANLFDDAPEGQPDSFVSGDYVAFKRSDIVTDYPTASYTAQYVARGIGDNLNEFAISSTKETTHFLFTSTSTATAGISAGEYAWQLEITRDSDSARIVIDRGRFTVQPDLDNSGVDSRSSSEIMLAKIESLLSGKADSDVAEYQIAGRQLKKMSFSELMEARNFYRAEVLREKQQEAVKNGRKGPSTIQVRF